MKKLNITIIIIVLVAAVLVVCGSMLYVKIKSGETILCWPPFCMPGTPVENIVGGDKDSHGCIGSAGYSWCEVKNKCLRVWEEPCEANVAP